MKKANLLKARYSQVNGIFSSGEVCKFVICQSEKGIIEGEVFETGTRTIIITSDYEVELCVLTEYLERIEKLLNIFDGSYALLTSLSFAGQDSSSHYESYTTQYRLQRPSYIGPSQIITSFPLFRLLKYDTALSTGLYRQWEKLLRDLYVPNQFYLLAISGCDLTIDVRCAFLCELFESVAEYVGLYKKGDSLETCIRKVISEYGKILFADEILYNEDEILKLIKNNRVNIMHIKLKFKKSFCDGKETMLYAMKLSVLYRIVILSLLGVDEEAYKERITKITLALNKWEGIMESMFARIGPKSQIKNAEVDEMKRASITIQKISITKLALDAVVNAANTGLWHGTGVCGYIFQDAGVKEMTDACNAIGHCDEGSAVITPGFRLPAKYVIHAVGPRYTDGKHGEPELLYSAYYKSLSLAMENGLHSIGFPLISAGIFGYPTDEAWQKALEACNDFLAANPDYEMDIVFAVLDDRIKAIGEQTLADLSQG